MRTLLSVAAKDFEWQILSFALMPNHIHILLKIHEANLSEGIKNMCETYARRFNKKYERKGPVFSRPYRAALCLDDSYLMSICTYIHLNPLRAGLCKDLNDYPWSSFHAYAKTDKTDFINSTFVLNIIDTDSDVAREKYLALLGEAASKEFKNIIEHPSFIEHFKNSVMDILKKFNVLEKEDALQKLINKFSERTRLRRKEEIQTRKYLIEQLLARGFQMNEIAEKLNVTRRTIYNTINFPKQASLEMGNKAEVENVR
jgi:putative transposase